MLSTIKIFMPLLEIGERSVGPNSIDLCGL